MADDPNVPPSVSPPTSPAPAPPAGSPPGEPVRKPRGKQLLILIGGGAVLAFGGCALFLSKMNFNSGNAEDALGVLGAIGFVAGGGMFIIGLLMALAIGLGKMFAKPK